MASSEWQIDMSLVARFVHNQSEYADFAEICCADFGDVGLH